jgi:hypothetical protein
MQPYEDMTKEELIKTLKELSSDQNIKQSVYENTLHKLEAHQIELETQNIELQESRRDLEESRNCKDYCRKSPAITGFEMRKIIISLMIFKITHSCTS